jgi:AcrR family transcriptional regulator
MKDPTSSHKRRSRRSYASPLRAAQAAQTRQRILDAAGRCFAASGYSATTLPDIAVAAEVSVETIQAHGPKRALLLAAFEQAFAFSEGQDSIFDRPEIAASNAQITDPVELIRVTCRFLARANVRSYRLWLALYHAAAADAAIAEEFDAFNRRVRTDWVRFVTMVADRGGLRTDRTPQELADELDVLHLPTNYERLTENAGWTLDTYTDYTFTNTCRILLPDSLSQPVGVIAPTGSAVSDV